MRSLESRYMREVEEVDFTTTREDDDACAKDRAAASALRARLLGPRS